MNRTLALTSLLIAGLLICDPCAAQTTSPKRMLGKFEVFSTPARFGYIDTKGKVVIEMKFDDFRSFSNGRAAVSRLLADPLKPEKRQRVYGFVGEDGVVAVPVSYSYVDDFSEGLARFRDKRWKYGYIDKGGNVSIPARFYRSGDFRNGRAVFWIKDEKTGFSGKCGFVDKFGAVIVPAKYKDVGHYSEGLAPAQDDKSKLGYIGLDGRVVILPKYERTLGFSCGLAAVKVGEKWGYIDKKGKTVIAPRYAAASHFKGQLARVNAGGGNHA